MPEPERTCIGCRIRATKSSMIRVAWQPELSAVSVDEKQSLPGRGAYVHLSIPCLEKGQRRVRGALRIPGTVDWATVSDPWAFLRTLAKLDQAQLSATSGFD
ncbi:YlxR family protein [Alphaproteobacteria bacterium]|nr:YlxR family protein [Alphaproteobacteria bacterium]